MIATRDAVQVVPSLLGRELFHETLGRALVGNPGEKALQVKQTSAGDVARVFRVLGANDPTTPIEA